MKKKKQNCNMSGIRSSNCMPMQGCVYVHARVVVLEQGNEEDILFYNKVVTR
jgi:hypothetical protein